jgi:hypothetical protein
MGGHNLAAYAPTGGTNNTVEPMKGTVGGGIRLTQCLVEDGYHPCPLNAPWKSLDVRGGARSSRNDKLTVSSNLGLIASEKLQTLRTQKHLFDTVLCQAFSASPVLANSPMTIRLLTRFSGVRYIADINLRLILRTKC